MKVAQLSGSLRANVGKKGTAADRNAGLVPCVLYGQGTQTHFTVTVNAINKIIFSPEVYKVELDIDGKKTFAVVKDLQQDNIKDTIKHVDFYELNDKKAIRLGLPVRLVGTSPGIMAGGKLQQVFRRLTVEGYVKDMPDAIYINIAKLKIGKSARVGQLEIPGLKFLDPKGAVVVSVKMARGAAKPTGTDDDDIDDGLGFIVAAPAQ
jgi:large subunit ribosomal protein L25